MEKCTGAWCEPASCIVLLHSCCVYVLCNAICATCAGRGHTVGGKGEKARTGKGVLTVRQGLFRDCSSDVASVAVGVGEVCNDSYCCAVLL